MAAVNNVIFDWSGTISNDLPLVYETVMKVFEHYGISRISLERFRLEYTLPYMKYARKFGITASKEEVDEVFNSHFRKHGFPQPLPNSAEAVEKLHVLGKRMVVLSSHRQQFLEEEARRFFGDKNYFVKLFGSVHNKEDEIENILQQLSFGPKETIIVGDTEHDILAGKSAGISTAAVLTGYRPKEKLAAAKPDFVINNLLELFTLGIL